MKINESSAWKVATAWNFDGDNSIKIKRTG